MQEHFVKIISSEYITHDVKRFTVEKPNGYTFKPGQYTEIFINKPEWKNEKRTFCFTSLNNWKTLEFTIKIYRDHKGVTAQLEKLQAGEEIIIRDPLGTIIYKGKGVFIAAGAGITPFIAIFRQLKKDNDLKGNILIDSNKTSEDIILKDEFEKMLGNNFHKVLTREHVIGFLDKRIDEEYLKVVIRNFSQHFYVCGPKSFVERIQNILIILGVKPDTIVIEK
jgi:ferredoxin-NADP reductase